MSLVWILAIDAYIVGLIINLLFLEVQYLETGRRSLLGHAVASPLWPALWAWYVLLLLGSFVGIGPGLEKTAVAEIDRDDTL
jgi:hypothetical protein